MRIESLKSPGIVAAGVMLRVEACKAISAVELIAGRTGGKNPAAVTLKAFFEDCASKLAGLVDAVAAAFSAGGVGPIRGADKVVVTFTKDLDVTKVPASSAFTLSPAKTISGVEVSGPNVILTVTVPFAAGNTITAAYTKPGSGTVLTDAFGNEVATFAAQSVTNALV